MPAASSSAAEPARPVHAAIVGLAGPGLGADERVLFAEMPPAGVILFARNCENPLQVRALVAEVRTVLGRDDAPVLIDQEGGACHTGYRSCFHRTVDGEVVGEQVFDPDDVYE